MAGHPITLEVPEEMYESAGRWAALTRREVPEVLLDVLTVALTPIEPVPPTQQPVSSLSDEEVLAASRARMKPSQGRRLSELLARQREGQLTDQERTQLLALMRVYEQLWLRQSEALAEAVRRGLRGPLRS